jgi:hypothetical protein
LVAEQLVAPVHRGLERLVALERRAGAPGQQPEAVRQPLQELPGWQGAHAGGGQLDGQGEAVQPGTDLRDRRRVPLGDGERRRDSDRSVDEEAHHRDDTYVLRPRR